MKAWKALAWGWCCVLATLACGWAHAQERIYTLNVAQAVLEPEGAAPWTR